MQQQKLIDTFVNSEVQRGAWREEEIPPEVSGLARSIWVFRAKPSGKLIAHDWHGDKQTFCPPMWWDLRIGSGACGLGCRACFLMLTFRAMRDPHRHVLYENEEGFAHATRNWLTAEVDEKPVRRRQHTLGLGIDRSDSLLYEGVTGHARRLAPLFGNPDINKQGNKLILLTKSANTHYLAEIEPKNRKNIIVTFSLNPEPCADAWEGKWDDGVRITPTITRRLEAARLAQDLGFEVRVRVDPILTIPDWPDHYAAFVAQVKSMGIRFRYWTLGTYREKNAQLDLWRAKWELPAMEWEPGDDEMVQAGTHRHLPDDRRIEIYRTVGVLIRREFPLALVSLCKETHVVRQALGLCNADCNCLI